MDGIVPYIYVFMALGITISFVLTISLSLYTKRKQISSKNVLLLAKANVILGVILISLTYLSRETIIGYSPLIYITPIQFIFILWSFYNIKKVLKDNSRTK